MRTSSHDRSTAARRSHVIRLQERLAFRLLLVFLAPIAVIAVLGVYAYRLSARLGEIEVLERMSYVDRIYGHTRNAPWALAEYQALAKRDPRNYRVFVRLGALYHEDGDDPRAVEALERAIELKRDNWEAYSTLAYVQMDRGNEAAAIAAGEAAVTRVDDVQAYNNLAWIYAMTKDDQRRDLAKAVDYAEKAVKFTRCRQKNYLETLADVYRRSGRTEDAARITAAGGPALALCARAAVASAPMGGR
jgi:tetratricopeptide (TPR) repeat protein